MGKSGSPMQLTRAADYAVRAMIHLACLPPGERVLLPGLAVATGAPVSFLSKVLQALCRAGFVASRRGHTGGFEILQSGRDANIGTVIRAIDGPIRLNACLECGDACGRRADCVAHRVWARAQLELLKILQEQTIAELAARQAEISPRKDQALERSELTDLKLADLELAVADLGQADPPGN